MLSIVGPQSLKDGTLSRRAFLQVGGLATCGLTLADVLRADASAGVGSRHKSVIMIFMPGGPSHLDFYDPKPDVPWKCAVSFGRSAPRSLAFRFASICQNWGG